MLGDYDDHAGVCGADVFSDGGSGGVLGLPGDVPGVPDPCSTGGGAAGGSGRRGAGCTELAGSSLRQRTIEELA